MKYPKLWPVGGHPEGEAKVRQMQKLGPKWLRASGPGWVAEKQGQQSNVKYEGGDILYAYGWGRRVNTEAETEAERYWVYGSPYYDEFWQRYTRWAASPKQTFRSGPHAPGVYLGDGLAVDVESTPALDAGGSNTVQSFMTLMGSLDTDLDDFGNPSGFQLVSYEYEEPHETVVTMRGVGRSGAEPATLQGFTPFGVVPAGNRTALLFGLAKNGSTCPDVIGSPVMPEPVFTIASIVAGQTTCTAIQAIPRSSMVNPEIGREWRRMWAVADGKGAVTLVIQCEQRVPLTTDPSVDVRPQIVVALTQDGGVNWINYVATDAIEPSAYYTSTLIDRTVPNPGGVDPDYPLNGHYTFARVGGAGGSDVSYLSWVSKVQFDPTGGQRAMLVRIPGRWYAGPLGMTVIDDYEVEQGIPATHIGSGRLIRYLSASGKLYLAASNDNAVTLLPIQEVPPIPGLPAILGLPSDLEPLPPLIFVGPITVISPWKSESEPGMFLATFVHEVTTPSGFYYRFVTVFSEDGGKTLRYNKDLTPNTPEWVSAGGPAYAAGEDNSMAFHKAGPAYNGTSYTGVGKWLGAEFYKVFYCKRNGRWLPADVADTTLSQG